VTSENAMFLVCFRLSEQHQMTGLLIVEKFMDSLAPEDVKLLHEKWNAFSKRETLVESFEFEKKDLIDDIKNNPAVFFRNLESRSRPIKSHGLVGFEVNMSAVTDAERTRGQELLKQVDFSIIESHFDRIIKVLSETNQDSATLHRDINKIIDSVDDLPPSISKSIITYNTPAVMDAYDFNKDLQRKYTDLKEKIEKRDKASTGN